MLSLVKNLIESITRAVSDQLGEVSKKKRRLLRVYLTSNIGKSDFTARDKEVDSGKFQIVEYKILGYNNHTYSKMSSE